MPIDQKIHEELDHFNYGYDIWFGSSAQLIEEINKIESRNLELVLMGQEIDRQLQDWRKNIEELQAAKDSKILDLKDTKDALKKKIKQEQAAIMSMTKEKANNEKMVGIDNFDKIKIKMLGLYNGLKTEFDKNTLRQIKSETDLSNEMMLDLLTEVEKLYYKYIKGFNKETIGSLSKNVC